MKRASRCAASAARIPQRSARDRAGTRAGRDDRARVRGRRPRQERGRVRIQVRRVTRRAMRSCVHRTRTATMTCCIARVRNVDASAGADWHRDDIATTSHDNREIHVHGAYQVAAAALISPPRVHADVHTGRSRKFENPSGPSLRECRQCPARRCRARTALQPALRECVARAVRRYLADVESQPAKACTRSCCTRSSRRCCAK